MPQRADRSKSVTVQIQQHIQNELHDSEWLTSSSQGEEVMGKEKALSTHSTVTFQGQPCAARETCGLRIGKPSDFQEA